MSVTVKRRGADLITKKRLVDQQEFIEESTVELRKVSDKRKKLVYARFVRQCQSVSHLGDIIMTILLLYNHTGNTTPLLESMVLFVGSWTGYCAKVLCVSSEPPCLSNALHVVNSVECAGCESIGG